MFSLKEVLEYGLAFMTLFVTVFYFLVFFENKPRFSEIFKAPKKLPSITLLIPAYNEEKTIAWTIRSALNARYPGGKKKVIVIDDGSTDSTLSIASTFSARGVTVIRQKNAGKASALNTGLARVKTELVATLDSDSYVSRSALMKMVGYFSDPKVGAVTSAMKVWKPKNALERFQRVEYLFGLFTRKMLSFIDSINVTPGPLSVFRKSIFDALGGYQVGNISEDQEMALRIQENQYKIACSLEADVFTAVPSSLPELVKQRVRWYRGGLRNFFKYTHLISPKYGDFGVLMMPLAIISTIALFLVLGLSAHTFLTKSQSFSPSLEDFLLGLTPFSVLSLLVMLSTVAWTLMGLRQLHRESLPLDHLILYLVLYAPLVTLFWLATAFREITKSSLKWS